jgi:DNA-directed RNA polymerase specialized sigma24 family protein
MRYDPRDPHGVTVEERELANRFDRQRPRLRAVAYRILGSLSEADDAVQEAWLRLRRTDAEQIESLERWLTMVVARICLNMLRSRRTRGEQPLDGFLPEPIIDDPASGRSQWSGSRSSVTAWRRSTCSTIQSWSQRSTSAGSPPELQAGAHAPHPANIWPWETAGKAVGTP